MIRRKNNLSLPVRIIIYMATILLFTAGSILVITASHFNNQRIFDTYILPHFKNKLIHDHFKWQDDYWAVGISQRNLNSTRLYILNQDNHHSGISFHNELTDFIETNQFNLVSDNKIK